MKKFNVLVAFAATVFVLTSCNSAKEKAASVESPVAGTDYVIYQENEYFGVKKNGTEIIPARYDKISYENNMFIGDYSFNEFGSVIKGKTLVDPTTSKEVLSSDSIMYSPEGYFYAEVNDGQQGIYLPKTKTTFSAMLDFVLDENIILVKRSNGWAAYSTKNDTIIAPDKEFQKMALVKAKKQILLQVDGNWWLVEDSKGLPGKFVGTADLKKFKKMKGWNDKAEAFILE